MKALEFRLLNDFQRDFPLVPEPYAVLAGTLGVGEPEVLEGLARLRASGAVSRVGAVFRPGALGASTLAATAVPAERLEAVATLVSRFREVNHNYERDHRYNLWFVAAAPDEGALEAVLDRIERATGIDVLALPLVEEYHIDLGFGLDHAGTRPLYEPRTPERAPLDAAGRRLAAALEDGLELVTRPYAALAARAGLDERAAIDRLAEWLAGGVVRRFGVVVRHHELGYRANAMTVWDVPDARRTRVRARARGERRRDAGLPPRAPPSRVVLQPLLHGARTRSGAGLGADRHAHARSRAGSIPARRPLQPHPLQADRRARGLPRGGAWMRSTACS